MKKIILPAVVISFLLIASFFTAPIRAQSGTPPTTSPGTSTAVQSDFAKDLQEGERDTANDQEAQKNQRDEKDNENVGVNEQGEVRNEQEEVDEQDTVESSDNLNQEGENEDVKGTPSQEKDKSKGEKSDDQ